LTFGQSGALRVERRGAQKAKSQKLRKWSVSQPLASNHLVTVPILELWAKMCHHTDNIWYDG